MLTGFFPLNVFTASKGSNLYFIFYNAYGHIIKKSFNETQLQKCVKYFMCPYAASIDTYLCIIERSQMAYTTDAHASRLRKSMEIVLNNIYLFALCISDYGNCQTLTMIFM